MARYLVTGGCGFIGSHLVQALLQLGHEVRVLDNLSTARSTPPACVSLTVADVSDPVSLGSFDGLDGCFHLAAIASVERSRLDWLGTNRTNLQGTINVLDAARRAAAAAVPVVYASSAAVYGIPGAIPVSEESGLRPLSAYGADKLGSEQHAFVAGCSHGVPTFGLRLFNVYGPGQDPNSVYSGVVSSFIKCMQFRDCPKIYGTGHQTRDFIFVDDVVRAFVAAMGACSVDAPVANICTGIGTSILSLACELMRVAGLCLEPRLLPGRIGDIEQSIGDPSLADRLLGFRSSVRLDEGLKRTWMELHERRPE